MSQPAPTATVDPARHVIQLSRIAQNRCKGSASRSRSLAELNRRLRPKGPPLERIIEAFLAEGRDPSVLEIGFGWGRVLIELARRFRSAPVSFAGINLDPHPPVERSGDLAAVAEALGLVPRSRLGELTWPVLYFYDATTLDLPDECLDLVYSAVTIRFIEDKARAIEEVARVLRPGGRALLEVDEKHWEYPGGPSSDPALFSDAPCRMVVHHRLDLVPLEDYLAWAGGNGFAIQVARRRHCVVDVTKLVSGRLDLQLELDRARTIPTTQFHHPFRHYNKGIRSVYAISDEAMQEYEASR